MSVLGCLLSKCYHFLSLFSALDFIKRHWAFLFPFLTADLTYPPSQFVNNIQAIHSIWCQINTIQIRMHEMKFKTKVCVCCVLNCMNVSTELCWSLFFMFILLFDGSCIYVYTQCTSKKRVLKNVELFLFLSLFLVCNKAILFFYYFLCDTTAKLKSFFFTQYVYTELRKVFFLFIWFLLFADCCSLNLFLSPVTYFYLFSSDSKLIFVDTFSICMLNLFYFFFTLLLMSKNRIPKIDNFFLATHNSTIKLHKTIFFLSLGMKLKLCI